MNHDASPSISVNIRRSLEEYLKKDSLGVGIDSVQKLQSECGIKLMMTGTEDPESVGCFVQYRIAFYVAGGEAALHNFFMFLDGYLEFKSKQFARATPFEVKIHPYDPFLLMCFLLADVRILNVQVLLRDCVLAFSASSFDGISELTWHPWKKT